MKLAIDSCFFLAEFEELFDFGAYIFDIRRDVTWGE